MVSGTTPNMFTLVQLLRQDKGSYKGNQPDQSLKPRGNEPHVRDVWMDMQGVSEVCLGHHPGFEEETGSLQPYLDSSLPATPICSWRRQIFLPRVQPAHLNRAERGDSSVAVSGSAVLHSWSRCQELKWKATNAGKTLSFRQSWPELSVIAPTAEAGDSFWDAASAPGSFQPAQLLYAASTLRAKFREVQRDCTMDMTFKRDRSHQYFYTEPRQCCDSCWLKALLRTNHSQMAEKRVAPCRWFGGYCSSHCFSHQLFKLMHEIRRKCWGAGQRTPFLICWISQQASAAVTNGAGGNYTVLQPGFVWLPHFDFKISRQE